MLYSGFEINAPEFIEYVTTYGGGYGTAGNYCEPLQSGQDGFFHDSISLSYWVEEADSENSPWHENGLSDWGYEYDGSGNWVGIFESCFGGCWGDNLFHRCYGTLDTEYGSGLGNVEDPQQGEEQYSSYYSYGSGLGKTEDPQRGEEQYGSYYSYDDDVEMQLAYDKNSWSGYASEFEYGEEEDCYGYGTEKPVSAYGNSSDEERLCESIFGYWPSVFGV